MCQDLTPQERAAIIAWYLARGQELTVADVARLTGLGRRGARKLVIRLSRVIPIHKAAKRWQRID